MHDARQCLCQNFTEWNTLIFPFQQRKILQMLTFQPYCMLDPDDYLIRLMCHCLYLIDSIWYEQVDRDLTLEPSLSNMKERQFLLD